ncbi:transposase (fragment) [Xenorhabdus bovienii str. oregonense]|uniref:Transposase n=1 Tax=Xenorhabdus bovienii str. oregonense TaxID=1398202 RepID=A0A077PBL9_XENBV
MSCIICHFYSRNLNLIEQLWKMKNKLIRDNCYFVRVKELLETIHHFLILYSEKNSMDNLGD